MRDQALLAHIILGFAIVALAIIILVNLKKKSPLLRQLSILTAVISWLQLIPAAILYLNFYPATKTLIKSGAWPWAHSVVMEVKEHWGILLPIVATVAALQILGNKEEESKKWWILVTILAVLLAVLGRIVKMGAYAS